VGRCVEPGDQAAGHAIASWDNRSQPYIKRSGWGQHQQVRQGHGKEDKHKGGKRVRGRAWLMSLLLVCVSFLCVFNFFHLQLRQLDIICKLLTSFRCILGKLKHSKFGAYK
jgi:hypothetical protein